MQRPDLRHPLMESPPRAGYGKNENEKTGVRAFGQGPPFARRRFSSVQYPQTQATPSTFVSSIFESKRQKGRHLSPAENCSQNVSVKKPGW